MTPEDFLKGIKKDIAPRTSLKRNIRGSITKRIQNDSPLFAELQNAVTPKKTAKDTVWKRISPFVDLPQVATFERIRGTLHPERRFHEKVREQVLTRITMPAKEALLRTQGFKWSAAFVLVALLVRMSPMLFIASPTVAESQNILLPTHGEVAVSIGGMWQPVERELALEPGMIIRTHGGQASLVFGDYGVIRIDEKTTIAVNDLSARLETASEILPMATLLTGRIWVQGLLPQDLRPLEIATSAGHIAVHEGSVSIAEDDYVNVEVYDRSAVVYKNGEQTYLTAGERTELYEDNAVLLVKKIPAKWFQYAWVDENFKRDAVHRHDIAQMQHERRIAKAGITPDSPLYPVKRFAEAVDVLMTLTDKSRVEKQLRHAETRLNEAAALIYNGDNADSALQEYKKVLNTIANGEADKSLAEFLVQRALAESQANIAAALPGDEAYAIKKTVLETSASIESPVIKPQQAQGELLLDGLAVMLRAVDEGRTDMIRTVWSDLHHHLAMVEDESLALNPSMYKEAQTLLTFLAASLNTASSRGIAIDPELLDDLAAYLPPTQSEVATVTLTEEEVQSIVDRIRVNIFTYDLTQPRINQFIYEMRQLANHPDLGRILRRLAIALPEGPESFPDRVYKEIVRLRWEKAAQETI